MSNSGPRKPKQTITNSSRATYEDKQGIYHSFSQRDKERLGKEFTKAVSKQESVFGLTSTAPLKTYTPLEACPEEDETPEDTTGNSPRNSPRN